MPQREQELKVDRVGGAVWKAQRRDIPRCVAVAEFIGVERHPLRRQVIEVAGAARFGVRKDRDFGQARAGIGGERVLGQDLGGGSGRIIRRDTCYSAGTIEDIGVACVDTGDEVGVACCRQRLPAEEFIEGRAETPSSSTVPLMIGTRLNWPVVQAWSAWMGRIVPSMIRPVRYGI